MDADKGLNLKFLGHHSCGDLDYAGDLETTTITRSRQLKLSSLETMTLHESGQLVIVQCCGSSMVMPSSSFFVKAAYAEWDSTMTEISMYSYLHASRNPSDYLVPSSDPQ